MKKNTEEPATVFLTSWERLKHALGFHKWAPWEDDYDVWVRNGCKGPVAFWRSCQVCDTEQRIVTIYE